MPHPDSIQLGLLSLGLSFHFPSSSVPRWSPITPSFIESDNLFDESSAEAVKLLRLAISDVGLGFQGEWIRYGKGIKVRCWILPSDVSGSMWKSIVPKYRDKVVKGLMNNVRRSWDPEEKEGGILMGFTAQDDQSMQEIYSSVPSPPDPEYEFSDIKLDQDLFDSLEAFENPLRVRTNMYRYQIRSVARMIKMEMQPEKFVDPIFIPIKEAGRDGIYYLNLNNWDIQRHPGWYDLPRGGILCEQMGTGKTLMCLSLITSTLHQPTLPPPNNIDLSPIITDLAERTYPFASNSDLRALTGYPKHKTKLEFPSLVELCSNVIATNIPSAVNDPNVLDIFRPLLERKLFYCTLPPDDECARYSKKKTADQAVKKVYLAKGTLVIVPQILIHQWQSEIDSHLEENALKVYNATNDELPSIEELLEYDVILMDTLRFGAEETQHRRMRGLKPSVLLRARWKRVILDEGHTAQSKLANSMIFARNLSVERRWLVSGTPTRHLQQGGETELESLEVPNSHQATRSFTPTIATNAHDTPIVRRPWDQFDLEDASRMGRMIGGYLAAEPFKTEGGFEKNVVAPLKKRQGPLYGAVRRLKYIMDGIMVKHAPKVIDIEAHLPPSTITNELLQFDPFQKITYNVLAALVASNVYTSGGEDVDYFLHANNRDSFLRVVDNLHLACFWYSARDMGTAGCLTRTQDWLTRHPDADPHVRAQLEEACQNLQMAIDTPGWDEWMTNAVSMPLDGQSFPSLIKEAWSDSFNSKPDMIDVHSFNTLRELNKGGKTIQYLHISGWDYRNDKLDEFQKTMAKYMEKHAKEQKRLAKAENSTAAKAPKAVLKSSNNTVKSTKKRKRQNMDEIEERLEEAERNANSAAVPSSSSGFIPRRPLPATFYTKSKSAKVNFIAQTLIASDKEDKFVIFGDAYELGHLTEILDLLDITCTFVGSESFTKDRRKALNDFQKPEIKVCLLDLKVGARGLNLVVANRVIFLRPIWNLDVQAQAIKRVHRIGQTRETKIQILVTEGTFEEDIAKRSTKNRSTDDEKLYTRAMIENPRFVYPEKEETETFAVRFIPIDETPPSTAIDGEPSTNGAAHIDHNDSVNGHHNSLDQHDTVANGQALPSTVPLRNGNTPEAEASPPRRKARVMFA
ncbi:uncharacterized protein L201_005440 [Kwoniella dendrophila CBS 6074]|uniref:Helicase C-terminal domain-containing protein n=1 Tax=Kwoniella dendrophila CBS 6074 TaxID=1295534 RepID=A0AAX4K059_9TREE